MTDKQYGYTLPGAEYPGYFNAKMQGDGQVALTVRASKKADGGCGDTAVVAVPPSEALQIAIGIRDIAGEAFRTPSPLSSEAQIKHMIEQFLRWKLPANFSPDCGISFEPEYNAEWNAKEGRPPSRHEPVGTNLFDYTQAEAMVRHMLDGLPD